jgi:hypothetical protein
MFAKDLLEPFVCDSPFDAALDCPFILAFLEAGIDPLEACEKPFVESPSARIVARRLRLRDEGRLSGRPGIIDSLEEATAAPSSGVVMISEVEGTGLLEGRRRRRRGLTWARENGWADRYSDEGESVLRARGTLGSGKGRSGWSGAKGWKGGLLARSKVGTCPVPWL